MKIGVLGSGAVGQALAKGFVSEGHEVWLATREPDGEKGEQLKHDHPAAHVTDFATAAKQAEMAVFCVKWAGAEAAAKAVGAENLAGKVVIDTSNIIKPEGDTLLYGSGDISAAMQVQRWFPDATIVKAFNTVGASMMYRPELTATPTMFIAGDDADAKRHVNELIAAFGWEPLDTGPLATARDLEAAALIWIRNSAINGRNHAFKML